MRLVDSTRPAAYAALIPGISKIAREFGYACAVHGSMTTDLDIVLVPWVDDARPALAVVEAIAAYTGGRKRNCDVAEGYEHPHGRRAWTLYMTEEGVNSYAAKGPYIDISVMPIQPIPTLEEYKALHIGLRNCLAFARQKKNRLQSCQWWEHIERFCAQAGVTPSLLRVAPGEDRNG